MAFGLGVALASTDFFDGRIARRANVVSRSGAFLDPLADKVVILGSGFCLVAVDRYWWLPVTLMAVREVGITAWRARWARHGLALPARRSAKYKTVVQGVASGHGGGANASRPGRSDRRDVVDRGCMDSCVWDSIPDRRSECAELHR